MIKSIEMKDVGIYEKDESVVLSELKKINFVYGANGAGKTTISNFIKNPSDEKYCNCNIKYESSNPQEVLVYNKKFKEENFVNGKIKGIFTLGNASKLEVENINNKNKELEEKRNELSKQRETLASQNLKLEDETKKFSEKAWKLYRRNESRFKVAFKGSIKSTKVFSERLIKEMNDNTFELTSPESLEERINVLFSESLKKYEEINLIDFSELNLIEMHSIWSKVIIGKDDVEVSELIKKLGNIDWVRQGITYIDKSQVCPFCQQNTVTSDFRKKIDDFFDESFSNELALLDSLFDKYVKLKSTFEELVADITSKENFSFFSQNINTEFYFEVSNLRFALAENSQIIENKRNHLSSKYYLNNTQEEVKKINAILKIINLKIKSHNDLVNGAEKNKEILIGQIWKYMCHSIEDDYSIYIKTVNNLSKSIVGISNKIETKEQYILALEKIIGELSHSITSVEPTVKEINRLLEFYGFSTFKLVKSFEEENFYIIQRANGMVAYETLSEGEITFITFLYYICLAKGSVEQETVNAPKILIVDDPISSLDSTILFVVSIILKDIIKNIKSNSSLIKQIIILTHNVYFHKEVSFIDGRTKENNDTNYWIIKRIDNKAEIIWYEKKNPIESSYELLWREIKESTSKITLQNSMRRILENFFKLLGNNFNDEIPKKFDIFEDQVICKSLLSWINDGSHCISDDLFVQESGDITEKYKKVFKDIFVKTKNEGHYEMMMNI